MRTPLIHCLIYCIGFQVFIRTLTGKTIIIVVSNTDTIKDVKSKIEGKNSVQPDHQKLLLAGRQLKDKQRVSDYRIKDECTLDLIVHGKLQCDH